MSDNLQHQDTSVEEQTISVVPQPAVAEVTSTSVSTNPTPSLSRSTTNQGGLNILEPAPGIADSNSQLLSTPTHLKGGIGLLPPGSANSSISQNPLEFEGSISKKVSDMSGSGGSRKMVFARDPDSGSSTPRSGTGRELRSNRSSLTHSLHSMDRSRHSNCHRTNVTYAATMDREALQSCYRWTCMCGEHRRKEAAKRTFLEVHGNGIFVNAPNGCCCCPIRDNATFLYFDDDRTNLAKPTGYCCRPCPYPCTNGCNCCGESIFVTQDSVCGRPSNFGHCGFSLLGLFCPVNVFYGLEEGEAERLASHISSQKRRFMTASME